MKKLDKIIQEELRTALNEQVQKIPFNGKLMTPGQIAISNLAKTDPYLSPVNPAFQTGVPWPSTLPRKKYPANIETFFKTIGAVPYTVTSFPVNEKNQYPIWHWNYGTETFRFNDNQTVNDSKNNVFTWRYVHNPDLPAVRDASEINKIQASLGVFQGRERNSPQIQFYTNRTLKDPLFTIILVNNRPTITYFKDRKVLSADEAKKRQIKAIRDILDWAGFIPVVGDAVDAFQAVWYWSDFAKTGNWEDFLLGCLSAIAIVPIVGSVVAKSGKSLIKSIRKTTGTLPNVSDIIRKVLETGAANLSAAQAKQLSNAIKEFAAAFASKIDDLEEAAKKVGLENISEALALAEKQFKQVAADIDKVINISRKSRKLATNLDDPLYNAAKELPNFTKWKSKISSLAYQDSAKSASKLAVGILGKIGSSGVPLANSLANGTIKLSIFAKETLSAAVTGPQAKRTLEQLNKLFVNSIKRDPARALALYRTASGRLKESIGQIILKNIAPIVQKAANNTTAVIKKGTSLTPYQISEYTTWCKRLYDATGKSVSIAGKDGFQLKQLIDAGYVPRIQDDLTMLMQTPGAMNSYIKKFANAEVWSGAAESIADYCIKNGHPIYNYILADPAAHLRTIFPEGVKDFFIMLGQSMKNGKKWLDIFYQGLHDVYRDIKIPDNKEYESVAYWAIKTSIQKASPDWAVPIADIGKQWIEVQKKTVLPAGEVEPGFRLAGVGDSTTTLAPVSKKKPAILPRGKAVKSNPFLKTL